MKENTQYNTEDPRRYDPEFIELYKRMTGRTNISLGELLERAIIDGIVKE